MNPTASILIYGHDPDLLKTRGWVLETAGFRVVSTRLLQEAGRLAATEPVKLLILCHTLSPDECQSALDVTEASVRKIESLFMTANTPVLPTATRDQVIDAFDGPRTLIAAAHGVLRLQASPASH